MTESYRSLRHLENDILKELYANIHEANALEIDWQKIFTTLNYIIGNPPFVGFTYQTAAQKANMQKIFPKVKNLDYVCCWFKKAADFIANTNTRAAFVSTNYTSHAT